MKKEDLLEIKIKNLAETGEFGQVSLEAQPYILARLLKDEKGPVFVLCQDDKFARLINSEIAKFDLKTHHLRLPQSRYEYLEMARLLSRLSDCPQKSVVSLETFFSASLPDAFDIDYLTLRTKEVRPLSEIRQILTSLGYELEDSTCVPGIFSIKGGMLSVFPINATNPFRIEYLGNTIEKIYDFDPISGNKISSAKSVGIMPFIPKAAKSIFDLWSRFKSKPKLFWLNPELGVELLTDKELGDLHKLATVTLSVFKKRTNLDFASAPKFTHRFEELFSYLVKKQTEGFKIFIDTQFPEKVVEVQPRQQDRGETSMHLNAGFISETNKFLLLTDSELFGKIEPESARHRTRAIRDLILGLKPGDLVIHIDHGLGKFIEIKKLNIEDVEREYLFIEYAGTDRLYVPVEVADRLTKYVKVTENPPPLARLGGAEWGTVRARIKASAEKLAKELLEIYAKRAVVKRAPYLPDEEWQNALRSTFAFEETPDQKSAIEKIIADMERSETPLDTLLTADVGYGKTEVAIRAALKAIVSGRQVAFLAPTTILAEQHFVTISRRLAGFPIKIGVLSRLIPGKAQSEILKGLADGTIDIVVGTHRLLSRDVKFKNLGLLIVDEEQRFGVEQKEKLKALRTSIDVIAMTATPIPRSMYLSLSGLRDIITIKTPPENRKPIRTEIAQSSDELIKKSLAFELKRNGQVYYINNDVQTINMVAEKIKKLLKKTERKAKPRYIRGARVAVAHGQLPPDQLISTMRDFADQKIDILVCSTIIENGLDLHNVNTLIVENAPDFGLAQLHQLRGRIGRGDREAFAYFLYRSEKLKEDALKRLSILAEVTELGAGYELALRDLEIRGAGNLLGREQHGNIVAVGISLYARLLEEAVRQLKTGEKPPEFETTIDLPLPITIPVNYIKEPEERLKTYQMLGACGSLEELNDERAVLISKCGPLPANVENLFALLELKLSAQNHGIVAIAVKEIQTPYGEKKLKLYLNFHQDIKPAQTAKLYKLSNTWQLSERQAKLDLSHLGKDWFLSLQNLIKSL